MTLTPDQCSTFCINGKFTFKKVNVLPTIIILLWNLSTEKKKEFINSFYKLFPIIYDNIYHIIYDIYYIIYNKYTNIFIYLYIY